MAGTESSAKCGVAVETKSKKARPRFALGGTSVRRTGGADSLNVGVAVGVTLYELVRRTCS
jgi:hypothetical protein